MEDREEAETHELDTLDFLLPQIPDDVAVDSFLMDWLASDGQQHTTTPEQGQPLPDQMQIPLPQPAHAPILSGPPQQDDQAQAMPQIPTPSLRTGDAATATAPGQWAGSSSFLNPSPSAFGDLSIQQGTALGAAPQPEVPPLVPVTERAGSGRYSLRPRSAHQKERIVEEDSEGVQGMGGESEEGSEEATRRHSGKRIAKVLSLANSGLTAVTKGLSDTVSSVAGAAMGGASGLAGSIPMPKKRSKDPDVIKQKELARNRRAQKAFRDRQKMLQSERTQSMRSLQESMGQLMQENSELKRKLSRVEAVNLPAKPQAEVDFSFGLPQDLSQEEPLSLTADPTHPLEISVEAVARLTYAELVDIWKRYAESISGLLEPARQDVQGEAYSRLEVLVKEIARLCQVSKNVNGEVWVAFQHSCLLNSEPDPTKAPRSHWNDVVNALQLGDDQVNDILTQRRQAFASLAVILRQRDELLQIQVDTLSGLASPDLKEDEISLAHARASGALQKLIDNLRAEQGIVLHGFCVVQQRTFSPIQRAVSMVQSWPYYPGSLQIASALAQQRGEPSAATLLGIHSSASGTNWSTSTATP